MDQQFQNQKILITKKMIKHKSVEEVEQENLKEKFIKSVAGSICGGCSQRGQDQNSINEKM